MSFSERPLTFEIESAIPGAAKEGAQLLGVSMEVMPSQIINAIDAFVLDPPKAGFLKKVDNWNERAMPLGALWGIQMLRRFSWEWTMIVQHEHDDSIAIAVTDKSRSMVIYPFHYVFGCLENKIVPTIALSFNMIEANSLPEFEPNSYENLMDGIQHVVPPIL